MKILIVLFSLFFSVESQGQLKLNSKQDTSKRNVAFVVDGIVVSREEANNVDVFDKTVIANPNWGNGKIYLNQPIDTVYVIYTKQGAISKYQETLSKFSKKYKSYLESHQNKDERIFYWILKSKSELEVLKDPENVIKKLYDIPADKIKKVDFTEKYSLDSHVISVTITLKS